MIGKYLVIVYPPPPATRDIATASAGSRTVANTPRIAEVDARFPADAAEKANVAPGGYCVVVTDAQPSTAPRRRRSSPRRSTATRSRRTPMPPDETPVLRQHSTRSERST